jgi:hypothetical protein
VNNYQSIATINAPEFINLEPLDINPMMSKCEIKVLYLGGNRNGTSINKQAATEMAKTLRGAPIVGYYKENKQDFFDHGEQIIYDGDGVHFNTLTKPYGFVSPDADVWFQEFEEFNEAGESVVRVYLMTTGYLWTGQYKEAQQIFNDGGKPQSMELDENSLQGFWSKEENSNMEFFIINDAVFSKLCILGDDVEPCFEGSTITAPNISKTFSLDNKFRKTLYSMMKELQETLQGGKGKVADEVKKKSIESSEVAQEAITEVTNPVEDNSSNDVPVAETPTNTTPAENTETPGAESETQDSANSEGTESSESTEGSNGGEGGEGSSDGGDGASDYVKKDDEKEDKSDKDNSSEKEDNKEDEKEEDDTKKKYSLLVVEFEELQQKYQTLQAQAEETATALAQYKAQVEAHELEKKDALIAEFYMLSDEDKKDVIDHKAEYTLDEIKSKLAVLCYDKKVSYVSADAKDSAEDVTVNIESKVEELPEWIQAVERHKNQ